MKEIKWIPLAERARREHKAYQTLRDKVVRGSLEGKKIKGVWHVPDESSIEPTIEPEAQSSKLNRPTEPLQDMISSALRAHSEALKAIEDRRADDLQRLQERGDSKTKEYQAEIKRLNDEHKQALKSKWWRVVFVFIFASGAIVAGSWIGWNERGKVAELDDQDTYRRMDYLQGRLENRDSLIETLQADSSTDRKAGLEREQALRGEVQQLRDELKEAQSTTEKLRHDLEAMTDKASALESALKASANLQTLQEEVKED